MSSLPVEGLTVDTGTTMGGDRVRGVVRVTVIIIGVGGRSALSGVLPAALLYSIIPRRQHTVLRGQPPSQILNHYKPIVCIV